MQKHSLLISCFLIEESYKFLSDRNQTIFVYYVYIFLEFEYLPTKKEHFQNNPEAEKAGDFIRQMFLEKVDKGRTIYTHYTCANGKHITLIKYPLSSRL